MMSSTELFADASRKAAARDLSVVELMEAAIKLQAANERQLAASLYLLWISLNQGHDFLPAVYFNCAVVLQEGKDLELAKAMLEESIRIRPDFLPSYINLGSLCEILQGPEQAMAQWSSLVQRLPQITTDNINYKSAALKQMARLFQNSSSLQKAEEMLRYCIEINPLERVAVQHWIAMRQRRCEWPAVTVMGNLSLPVLLERMAPLTIACYSDDPMLGLVNAYQYNKHEVGFPAKFHTHEVPEMGAKPRLRIGYVSSDLRGHAIGYLMAEIFELHDRDKVEIYAYYTGPAITDPMMQRISATVDRWFDVTAVSDDQMSELIHSHEVDILVDVNGPTRDGRPKVFARKPAPIIVNWLGFPGTTGSPYHNYIIADTFVIPPGSEIYYTEKVVRLPCYQPNDRKRLVDDTPTRAEVGLPEEALVFCCFNGTQKISRVMFACWMTILQAVPNSVLWILSASAEVDQRLVQHAAAYGIEGSRLIFAEHRRNAQHLARYPLADLFLDTWPYGAHTTSSDALWMGVPVLTLAGSSFASRVCGSLLSAAGLPELVCHSTGEYIAKACALAGNQARLMELRQILLKGRESSVLFDTPGLVRALESLFREMWEDYASGRLPRPDMTNLELYTELATQKSWEDTLPNSVDYAAYYTELLAERSRFMAVPYDKRLHPARQ